MLNRIFFLSFFLLTFFLFSDHAQAAAPANDNVANAQTISGASGTIIASNVEATREANEATHTNVSTSPEVHQTVWFVWTATESKPVVFDVSAITGFDPAIAVYAQQGNATFDFLTRNNNTNGGNPRVEFEAIAGKIYKIVVGSYNSPNLPGEFTLDWAQNDVPTNDNFNDALNIQYAPFGGSVAVTNKNATREANEPEHFFNNNHSVWFTFTNPNPYDLSVTFDTDEIGINNPNTSVNSNLMVYTGASYQHLTPVVKNRNGSGTFQNRVTFLAKTGITYRIAIDAGNGSGVEGNSILNWKTSRVGYSTDFGIKDEATKEVHDDNRTDITVFRPSDGTWYYLDSLGNTFHAFQFGAGGDKPVQADYDGDGRTDFAVTRDVNGNKIWYITNSFDNSYRVVQWGLSGDKPVPGDYDSDGRMDIAVFRPSEGIWYIIRSKNNQMTAQQFGTSGDIPVLGDFTETFATDLAVFRPSTGVWYIAKADGTYSSYQFGQNGDKPVPADYTNDGRTDIAVFRPSNGTWYIRNGNTGNYTPVKWGLPGDIPQPGNYDYINDQEADFTVFRPGVSNGTWYTLKKNGTKIESVQFGLATDIPASSLANVSQ